MPGQRHRNAAYHDHGSDSDVDRDERPNTSLLMHSLGHLRDGASIHMSVVPPPGDIGVDGR